MYNNIPKLQTGAYIPGLSSSLFSAGLARDIAKTQADIRSQARDIKRKQRSGGIFGKIGSFLGKSGVNLLTKGLMASNPLLAMGLKAAGTGLGSYLGSKLGYGKDVGITKGSELLGSQFKDLSEFQEGIGKERVGSAVASGLQTFAEDLKSEYGQKLMDSLKAKKAEELTEKAYAVAESQGEDVFDVIDGVPYKLTSEGYLEPIEMKGVLSESMPTDIKRIEPVGSVDFDKKIKDYFQSKPLTSYMDTEKVTQPSLPKPNLLGRAINYGRNAYNLGRNAQFILNNENSLLNMPSNTLQDRSVDVDSNFLNNLENNSTNNIQNALLGLSNTISQYNTPGMAHGGYVPEKGFGGLIQHRKGY